MLQTRKTAWLPLQKFRTIDLNVSCPAVSHIWSLIIISFTEILLEKNSIPTVGLWEDTNSFLAQRNNRQLFPTPVLPITMNLQVNSADYNWSIFLLFIPAFQSLSVDMKSIQYTLLAQMEQQKIRGFKYPKTMRFLGDLSIACGSHWRYDGDKGSSYQTTTLQPYQIQERYFNEIREAQKVWIKLLIKLSEDLALIEKLHEGYLQDEMISRILAIAKKVQQKNNKIINFFLIRCDYIFNEEKKTFQQTEFNAIAPGCFAMSGGVQEFHRCLQYYRETPSKILFNPPKPGIIEAFKKVHRMYEAEYKTKAAFLMVAAGKDNDSVEQAEIQRCLLLDGIEVVKRDFEKIDEDYSYDEQTGVFKVRGMEISVVYYRQGYNLKAYSSKNAWEIRQKLELSRAITCPNPFIHLLNFKNIQTKLKTTSIIKEILSEQEAQLLQKLQTTIFTIQQIRDKKEEIIAKYKNNLVVKSIHEGTGQNFFNEQAVQKINEMKAEEIMVMELIKPISRSVQLLGQDYSLIQFNAVSQIGLFGSAIYKNSSEIEQNQYIGYLIRTLEEDGKGQKQENYNKKGYDALALI